MSRSGVALVERGIRNLLAHAGVIEHKASPTAGEAMRLIEVRGRDYFVLAPDAGLFEHAVALGETVEEGQLCGQIHFVDDPARPPVPAYFRTAGTVVCTRHFGRVERGDCIAHLATPLRASS